ncbi:MAG: TetR/AcrR family transcriptional regulator [Coriobacteriales bacterium]|jgi:AcrR family transcriptional regulator|nr:TetR/AcrR family transcriptional regulator [Coriobacteriales bacterium]
MDDRLPTKERIVRCALDLFSSKGYSETTIRDIALEVDLNPASLYYHFPSKEDVLKYILADYIEYTRTMFHKQNLIEILKENPTPEGISMCIMSCLSVLTGDWYYMKLLRMIHQEQHRIEQFRDTVLRRFQETESYIERVFDALKSLNLIESDTDPTYWKVSVSSLMYAFSNRLALSDWKDSQYNISIDITDMFICLFDMLLKLHGVQNQSG